MNRDAIRTRAFAEPEPGTTGIGAAAKAATNWLFSEVLPLWAVVGRDHAHGGFFEQIGFEGAAIKIPKRCRVQARQVYVFVEAGRIGWNGSWQALADNGLDFMLDHHLRSDGLMRFKTEVDGAPHDDSVDNYDQAFAIFALAHAYAVNRDPRFPLVALAILAALRRERAHPLGGFLEAIPGRAPLLSNPHMHLFEAALAWLDVAPTKEWRELAQEIGVLCQTRFIDSATGALREYFQDEWAPSIGEDGQIIEPGHQFEWAWLLARWRDHGGDVDLSVIRGLYAAADANGVDRTRSLALGELWMDGSVKDAGARMWPQTERMKAALAMARLWPEEQARFEADAVDAWAGVQRFIFPENRGLFRDKMKADGAFIAEGALASSLFHIVCAISELVRYANREARP